MPHNESFTSRPNKIAEEALNALYDDWRKLNYQGTPQWYDYLLPPLLKDKFAILAIPLKENILWPIIELHTPDFFSVYSVRGMFDEWLKGQKRPIGSWKMGVVPIRGSVVQLRDNTYKSVLLGDFKLQKAPENLPAEIRGALISVPKNTDDCSYYLKAYSDSEIYRLCTWDQLIQTIPGMDETSWVRMFSERTYRNRQF